MTERLAGYARAAALFSQASRSLAWAAEEMSRAAVLDPMPFPDQAAALRRASDLAAKSADLLDDAAHAVAQGMSDESADVASRASDLLHDAAVLAAQGLPLMQQAGSRIPKVGDLLHQESAWLAGAAESLRAGREVA